jgi:predicted esterase
VDGLRAAGLDVESHVCAGLGHGIDEEGLLVAAQFLRRLFPA